MMTTRPWALGSGPGVDEQRAWNEIANGRVVREMTDQLLSSLFR